jgi:adenylate cyclase class IV
MRASLIAVIFLCLSATQAVSDVPETIAQLKQRAQAAKQEKQPKLFLEVAQRQLAAAAEAYHKDDVDAGKAAIEDVAAYCEKAGAAANASRKHRKETEITVRDMARKLEVLRRDLSLEEAEPVQAAISRLEKVRTALLNAMFGPKP